jgi:hypothetical protein
MVQDVVDSPDYEFDQLPDEDPFANLGLSKDFEASLERNRLQLRRDTKQDIKPLRPINESIKTDMIGRSWCNRWQSFLSAVMQMPKDTRPTGDLIIRFLGTMVSQVHARGSSGIPSRGWAKTGLSRLNSYFRFYHSSWGLTALEQKHVKSYINRLQREGKLTRDPKIMRHWAGVLLVRRLVNHLYTEALTSGTVCWDVTIAKAASIVLSAALIARAGDITKHAQDTQELPYLAYQDVVLRVRDAATCHLDAEFTVRNLKGYK